jgi:uncharacterized membrane protein (UPF0127 family)
MRLALILAALPFAAAAQDCAPGHVEVEGGFGAARFSVEVADDPEERARGLMFVERLGPMEGMLFVYEREADGISFWMKNTLIPLDMIFADGEGTVVSVHAEAVPGDLTPIPAGAPARFVLEVPGGRAAALGIAPGDALRHPAIPDSCAD